MEYLTYFGNDLINIELPAGSKVLFPPPPIPGLSRKDIPGAVRRAFENPLGMAPLGELVDSHSRVLIAFDDNCQPFPLMRRPDFRQLAIEALLELLLSYGVRKEKILLMCAVALHRKMRRKELQHMLGKRIMSEFYPHQLKNFDAEDPEDIVQVGKTEKGEEVETTRAVLDCDLVIYVDTIQIPLNGGHKSVAVGFGTYNSLYRNHAPQMTESSPHLMQPEGSHMHASIRRISQVIEQHARIMVLEAPMNGATYPDYVSFLAKSPEDCNVLEERLRKITPKSTKLLPEALRRNVFRSLKSEYSPLEINAGSIDAVHARTLKALHPQLAVTVDHQYSTLIFGLPDLSPYSIGARVNPVLVVSDVLGYVFNWFYNKPFVRRGGVVIILNPVFEVFHPEYHVAYERFWNEVLVETADPFEMQAAFQEDFARDPALIDCYRNKFAHHGFHPFTVWYWATYPLSYLSRVIIVGPPDDKGAKRLGVDWAPNLEAALGMAKEITGELDVLGLTIPPFLYVNVED